MRSISNVHAGRRFPTPVINEQNILRAPTKCVAIDEVTMQLSGFQPGCRDPRGCRLAFFLEVGRASNKNIHNYFHSLYFVYGTNFYRSQKNRIT